MLAWIWLWDFVMEFEPMSYVQQQQDAHILAILEAQKHFHGMIQCFKLYKGVLVCFN